MNQEYLWSKKGGDAEAERLERLLSEFRFDGNLAAVLPAANTITVASTLKRRFVLGLSFAATAAALVLVSIWIARVPTTSVATRGQNPGSVPEPVQTRNDDRVIYPATDRDKDIVPTAGPALQLKRKTNDARTIVNRNSPVIKAETTKLTKEEKYAYDRLMLALSIAGSRLRVIQDTIDRKGDAAPQTIRNEK